MVLSAQTLDTDGEQGAKVAEAESFVDVAPVVARQALQGARCEKQPGRPRSRSRKALSCRSGSRFGRLCRPTLSGTDERRANVLSCVPSPVRNILPKLVELPLTVSARLMAMLGPANADIGPLAASSVEVAARLLEGSAQLVQELHLPAARRLSAMSQWGPSEERALRGLRRWHAFGRAVRVAGRAAPLLGVGTSGNHPSSLNLALALAAADNAHGRQTFVSKIAGA